MKKIINYIGIGLGVILIEALCAIMFYLFWAFVCETLRPIGL